VKRFKIVILSVAAAAVVFLVQAVAQGPKDLPTAIQSGASKQALELIRAGADVNQAQGEGSTPLLWAVNRSDYEVAEALLAKKANPNAGNEFGALPLTEAARLNDDRMVKMLLDAGAKVDSASPDGETVLMLAIKNGNQAMFQTLVAAGADVNVIEKFHNQTPLMYAASAGRTEMVKALLSKDADIRPRSLYTDWPSQVTSEPRVQYRSVGGLNALMFSIRAGCYSCVEQLLAAGANINFYAVRHETPLALMFLDIDHFKSINDVQRSPRGRRRARRARQARARRLAQRGHLFALWRRGVRRDLTRHGRRRGRGAGRAAARRRRRARIFVRGQADRRHDQRRHRARAARGARLARRARRARRRGDVHGQACRSQSRLLRGGASDSPRGPLGRFVRRAGATTPSLREASAALRSDGYSARRAGRVRATRRRRR